MSISNRRPKCAGMGKLFNDGKEGERTGWDVDVDVDVDVNGDGDGDGDDLMS